MASDSLSGMHVSARRLRRAAFPVRAAQNPKTNLLITGAQLKQTLNVARQNLNRLFSSRRKNRCHALLIAADRRCPKSTARAHFVQDSLVRARSPAPTKAPA